MAIAWSDGVIRILRACQQNGPPSRKAKDWYGRWWFGGGAIDFLPLGNKVLALNPAMLNPFADMSELEVTGANTGTITLANGFGSYGETVRCARAKSGKIVEGWFSGHNFQSEAKMKREVETRYGSRRKLPT